MREEHAKKNGRVGWGIVVLKNYQNAEPNVEVIV